MDGEPPLSGTPIPAGKASGNGKKKSSGSGDEAEEDSESEESSSSSLPVVATSPTATLEHFRREWEAELKKVTGTSNINSTLNLASASPASLANPFPNPTSMAGAVSRSKPTTPTAVSDVIPIHGEQQHHPFATAAPRKLVSGSGAITGGGAGSGSPSPDNEVLANVPESGTIEEQARKWFLQGIGFERHGDLYDAVRCYRRAIQLVPDIEYRIGTGAVGNANKKQDEPDSSSDEFSEDEEEDLAVEGAKSPGGDEVENEEEDGPLMTRFLKTIEKNGWQFFEKGFKTEKKHLSDLPVEVVSYILRWVVSKELDIRSVDLLSRTCKGFFCICRDEKLWEMVCQRLWCPCNLTSTFPSYREMYLNRPRVRFDGCYISRVTYIRAGEHSFQDQSYRPWHFVEYYRYIRFFPDGHVHFLTSSEEPGVAVPGLREKQPRNVATLKGKYQLYGNNLVTAMVKKPPPPPSVFKNKRVENPESTSFHIEFEICPLKGRNNWMLKWAHHAVFISKNQNALGRNINARQNQNNATVVSTTFDLIPTKYPPLYFSRVKSYTTRSESILE